MVLKCCIQYVSKSGKPSSGPRTGKCQFSSQFQRRAVLKIVPTIRQFCSLPKLACYAQHSSSQISEVCESGTSRGTAGFRKGRSTRDQIANSVICIYFNANRWRNNGNCDRFSLLSSKITTDVECNLEIRRHLLLGKKATTNLKKHLKKLRHHFSGKYPHGQSYAFSSSYVWM